MDSPCCNINTADRSSRSRALLIVPAYNEAENIQEVVGNLVDKYSHFDCIVINDGSTDNTAEVCRNNSFRFIDLPINLGLAGAFQAGIKYAYRHGYEYAIQFDADGQHLPEYLDDIIAALDQSNIVIGSRFVTQGKPVTMRMLGSNLLSLMIRFTTGRQINDPTSGMRGYDAVAIKELAVGPNLGPEPDTIAYLIKKKGLTVKEIQVRMGERLAGESYLNWKDSSIYMLRMVFSVLFIQFFR